MVKTAGWVILISVRQSMTESLQQTHPPGLHDAHVLQVFFLLHNRTRQVAIHHHPCRRPVLRLQTACAVNGVMFYGTLQWWPLSVCCWPFQRDAGSSTLFLFFFFPHSYSLMEFSFDLYSNRMTSGSRSSAAAISHFGESTRCPAVTRPRWKTGMIMVSGSADHCSSKRRGLCRHGHTWEQNIGRMNGLHVTECATANQICQYLCG